jgi:hypothetical protein
MALAEDHPEAYAVCYQKAVDRLNRLVVEHEYPAQYAYYKVPSPWLQVKLLRLLQYYPPSGAKHSLLILAYRKTSLRGSHGTVYDPPSHPDHHE